MTRYEAMDTFERDIKPYLNDVSYHAKMVAWAVRRISFRPSFVTNAQYEMIEAEKVLMDGLEIIRAAQAEYGALPVEVEQMEAAE